MKTPKFSKDKIFQILKEAEGGVAVPELCRKHGMSSASFYTWRSKYSGMDGSSMKRLKEIEDDGADVLILGSTTMRQSHAYLKQHLPVPVINPGLVAYKICEMILELELCHSKTAFPDPEAVQDENLFMDYKT